jgi:hypothetical protein
MEKRFIFFEVGTKFLYIIQMNFVLQEAKGPYCVRLQQLFPHLAVRKR